jgi:hypothetical protein
MQKKIFLISFFIVGILKVNENPDPLVRGIDPLIRIHTKMALIRNTVNNVAVVYLTQVSLLLIGQQDWEDFFRYRPFLPIGW